jgi:hypothetical protein
MAEMFGGAAGFFYVTVVGNWGFPPGPTVQSQESASTKGRNERLESPTGV